MSSPQRGLFVEGSPFSHYLEYRVADDVGDADLRSAIAACNDLGRSRGQHVVVAFGGELWWRLAPDRMPEDLRPFEALGDPKGHYAPATQRDIWLWTQGPSRDDNLDLAFAINDNLSKVATLELDLPGFTYHGDRDLIGFVDGTGNPKDQEGKEAAALIPHGGGGAFLMTQQWVHDLPKFTGLEVATQEAVVGRTKVEDIELEGDAMPADSHVSRTDVTEDGVAMKVYRRSSPYGGVREHGLYYVAFACDPYRFDIQLRRMYGLTDDKLHDRLIEFSRAVTGAYWYVPGTGDLEAVFGVA